MVFKEKQFQDNLTLALVDQYQKLQASHNQKSSEESTKAPVLSLYHIKEEHILFADYARLVLKKLNETGITENLKEEVASTLDSIVTKMTMGIKSVKDIDISNNEIHLKKDVDSSYKKIDKKISNAFPQACADAYIEMTRKAEPKLIIPATNFATYFLSYIEQEIENKKDESLRLSYGSCDEHDSFDKNYGRFITKVEKQLQNKATVQIDEGDLRREISTIPISKKDGKLYFDRSISLEESKICVEEDLECLVNDGILKNLTIKTRNHFLGLKKDLKKEEEIKREKR